MAVLAAVRVVFPLALFSGPGSGTKPREIPKVDSSGADIFLIRSVAVMVMMVMAMIVMVMVVVVVVAVVMLILREI